MIGKLLSLVRLLFGLEESSIYDSRALEQMEGEAYKTPSMIDEESDMKQNLFGQQKTVVTRTPARWVRTGGGSRPAEPSHDLENIDPATREQLLHEYHRRRNRIGF